MYAYTAGKPKHIREGWKEIKHWFWAGITMDVYCDTFGSPFA
jgi:hypothetical protein